jgi:prepilin-type N-terminal cleavage/methylation domain-containing protein
MNQKGATLIEMILGIVIIGILAYVVSDAFIYASRSVLTANSARDATQSGRLAIDRMVREIRNIRDNRCVAVADGRTLTFVDMGNNTVAFSWSGVAGAPLMRNADVLVDQVSNLALTYLNNQEPPGAIGAPIVCGPPNTCLPACAATDIWSIDINLTTQSGTETMQFRSQVHPVNF